MSQSITTRPLEVIGHTEVITDVQGNKHVQHYGAEHVIDASVTVITLPPDARVIIRHLKPTV